MPSKDEMRAAADAFVAKARAKGVPLAADEMQARMKVGPLVLANWPADGTFDESKAMEQLMEQYGMNMEDSDDERERKGQPRKREGDGASADGEEGEPKAKKAKKKASAAKPRTGPNAGIMLMLDELAGFEFGIGETFTGQSYKKAAKTIQELDYAIESGAQTQGQKRGVKNVKEKVPNIGKGIAAKIDEYLATGTCAKLEAHRNGTVEVKEPKEPKEAKVPKEPKAPKAPKAHKAHKEKKGPKAKAEPKAEPKTEGAKAEAQKVAQKPGAVIPGNVVVESAAEVAAMGIGELKRILGERQVRFEDCLEKGDLVARALEKCVTVRPKAKPKDERVSPFFAK